MTAHASCIGATSCFARHNLAAGCLNSPDWCYLRCFVSVAALCLDILGNLPADGFGSSCAMICNWMLRRRIAWRGLGSSYVPFWQGICFPLPKERIAMHHSFCHVAFCCSLFVSATQMLFPQSPTGGSLLSVESRAARSSVFEGLRPAPGAAVSPGASETQHRFVPKVTLSCQPCQGHYCQIDNNLGRFCRY
jgi:hypothetical protein